MPFIYSMAIFSFIAISSIEASTIPINTNIAPYENLKQNHNDALERTGNVDTYLGPSILDISLLPTNEDLIQPAEISDIEELLRLVGVKQGYIEEIVKLYGKNDFEAMESDVTTCVIRAVTSFITCMHMNKENMKEETQSADTLKCLSKAADVFVKCLLTKPSSLIYDTYVQNT